MTFSSLPRSLIEKIKPYIQRWKSPLLFLCSVLLALVVFTAYDALRPKAPPLTERALNEAVSKILGSATPRPAVGTLIYRAILPSVVLIESEFSESSSGTGTGVIFNDSGLILSSLHVVDQATKITVTFFDGTESSAEIFTTLPDKDIVVLRPQILPDDLVPAVLAGSANLQVGDEVYIVGHPFGIPYSFTSGVVSGLNRTFRSRQKNETLTGLIQFDAAANPGNSGGPLLNRQGEVVGIVSALLNPTAQEVFIGIGFAVTIDTAASAMGSPPY